MELRVLRYFLAVAREQNITRAAEALHVTQPTLSKQLMDLEEELGQKLFVRGKRKVTLTEAGEFLRWRAQEIAELADKTEEAFRKTDGEISGDIWIACGETEGMRILVRAMKKLHECFPDVRFHLYSGNDADVADRMIFPFSISQTEEKVNPFRFFCGFYSFLQLSCRFCPGRRRAKNAHKNAHKKTRKIVLSV